MEASQISKSTTSETRNEAEMMSAGKSLFSDNLDPLFDQMTAHVKLPRIFYKIFMFFVFLQCEFTSTWVEHADLWDSTTTSKGFIKYFHYITNFSPVMKCDTIDCSVESYNGSDILVTFIVFTVLFLISYVTIVAQVISFRKHRQFNKTSLFATRIVLELFPLVLLQPIGVFSSQMFRRIAINRQKDAMIISFFIICLIEFVFLAVICFYTTSIIGGSAYLSNSSFSSFDYRPFLQFVILSPLFAFLTSFFSYFPVWALLALIVAHIILMCWLLYCMILRPFVSKWTNCVFFSTAVSTICNDLMRFVTFFIKNPNGTIAFALFFVFVMLSILLSLIFYHFQEKKMMKELTSIFEPEESNEENEANINSNENHDRSPVSGNDDLRSELYMNLKFDTNERKCLVYLDFIISHHILNYLDFSIVKYIMLNHRTNNVLIHCIKILICFPANYQFLNQLFYEAIRRREMNFVQHFFLFQVKKIKMLRQSSSSLTAGQRLKELKNRTKGLESTIRNFWETSTSASASNKISNANSNAFSADMMITISKELVKCRALWEESLVDFPNSLVYTEECAKFYVECATDFVGAIRVRHRSEMIETGRNFNVDLCFRQFVRNFPVYLKKNIVNPKGEIVKLAKRKKKGSNASNSMGGKSGSTDGNSKNGKTGTDSQSELDVAVEEAIGKTLVSHSKIRLALQRSTESRKANSYMTFLICVFSLFVVGLVIFLFVFIYFCSYFDKRIEISNRIEMINLARMYIYSSAVMLIYDWGNITNVINIDNWIADMKLDDTDDDYSFLHPEKDYSSRSIQYNMLAQDQYKLFLDDISTQSKKGINMQQYTSVLFQETTNMSISADGILYSGSRYNLKTVMMYIFLSQTLLSGASDKTKIEKWFTENRMWGTTISTLQLLPPSFDNMRTTLTEMSSKQANEAEKLLFILMVSIPIPLFVINFVVYLTSALIYKKEIEKFILMLLHLPNDAKNQAALPIKHSGDESVGDVQNCEAITKPMISKPVLLLILFSLIFIVYSLLLYFQIQNITDYNIQYENLNLWSTNSRIRKSLVMQLNFWIHEAMVMNNTLVRDTNFTDLEQLKAQIKRDFKLLDIASESLIKGTDVLPSSSGVDEVIDDWSFNKKCEANESRNSIHELYRCGSVMNLLSFFINTIDECLVSMKNFNGEIKDEMPSQIQHLTYVHLMPRLLKIDSRWGEIADKFKKEFLMQHIIYFVVELVLLILYFALSFLFLDLLSSSYSVVMLLLRRVSPISIVAAEDLMNYLLYRTNVNSRFELSTDQGIIYNSTDSILCTGSNGVIDLINPSVSKTFGFTPEQLLGQPITMMFESNENQVAIAQQLELMRNRQQSSLTFEDHTICVTDDDSSLPCEITILTRLDEDSDQVKSFVIILRDESVLVAQQQEAETAKKQSESLLFQILPRNIVTRINQGEKDISFSVPNATIMFIDIVKFSEYASHLTPQEIMGNLSIIFAGFDEMINKYDLLIKIKLIGDVYMSAGGLFSPDEPPLSHAEQMIHFAFDAIQVLEDSNVRLNSLLSVRIGINTGGPLIAGVLGTDKPIFDIIGDPINIASRLQSTDIPGKVQISQTTYDVVVNQPDFMIESRGEIFLKGKGKQPAYLVSLPNKYSFNISSTEGLIATLTEKDLKSEIAKLPHNQ